MNDKEIWFNRYAPIWIEKMDIKKGQIILDFGSGEGNYTIPLAIALGHYGKIYAYEKDPYEIKELNKQREKLKLTNIEIVRSIHNTRLPFKEEMFDTILLYDVLHSYYFSCDDREKLLLEVYRTLKSDGILSIFPKHISEEELLASTEKIGFSLVDKIHLKLLHYGFLEEGIIINFKKLSSR